jgi:hypothetical protein
MADLDPALVSDYACEDADVTLQLRHVFEPMLKDLGLLGLLTDVENPLVPVLADIEHEGVRIDSGAMNEYSAELQGYVQELETQIFREAGQEFNIGSPKQLGEVLFDKMDIGRGKIKKTKTGQYATADEQGLAKEPGQPLAVGVEVEGRNVVGILVNIARKNGRVKRRQAQAHPHPVFTFQQNESQPQADFDHAREQHHGILVHRHEVGHLGLKIAAHEGEVASTGHHHEGAQQAAGYVLQRGSFGGGQVGQLAQSSFHVPAYG